MSTHNIGFHENLTTHIFHLSSNIVKYVHYLFLTRGIDYIDKMENILKDAGQTAHMCVPNESLSY